VQFLLEFMPNNRAVSRVLFLVMLSLSNAFRYLSSNSCYRPARSLVQHAALSTKTYLNVPFGDKEEVKKRGGRWDSEAKKWYVGEGATAADFAQWGEGGPGGKVGDPSWLTVPFADKDEVKTLGARWDKERKRWFVPAGVPLRVFERWLAVDHSNAKPTQGGGAPAARHQTASAAKSVLFVDVETSGLPANQKGGYPPPSSLDAYDGARAVKVSASLCDLLTLQEKESFSLVVKSDGFKITNSEFHGVTDEISRKSGVDFGVVSSKLGRMLQSCVAVAAHNAAFDRAVLASELHRHGQTALAERLLSAKALCTMELSRDAVGRKDVAGKPKNPTMRELYAYALGEAKARSTEDLGVQQVREAFVALVDRGVIPRPMLDEL
jgi:DNA polymerase III epsilon subunit-like protein